MLGRCNRSQDDSDVASSVRGIYLGAFKNFYILPNCFPALLPWLCGFYTCMRACIFISSGFRFVSICRSDKISVLALGAFTDISIQCLSRVFPAEISIFILHWPSFDSLLQRHFTELICLDVLKRKINRYKTRFC